MTACLFTYRNQIGISFSIYQLNPVGSAQRRTAITFSYWMNSESHWQLQMIGLTEEGLGCSAVRFRKPSLL